jgi:hypothetical protein
MSLLSLINELDSADLNLTIHWMPRTSRGVEAAGEMLTDPNKNARIVWAMMASGECYRQDETYAA